MQYMNSWLLERVWWFAVRHRLPAGIPLPKALGSNTLTVTVPLLGIRVAIFGLFVLYFGFFSASSVGSPFRARRR